MGEVLDCTTPEGLAPGVAAAAAAVRSGGVVVLPTDTVYGVGCDAFDASAVTAVLAAKGRGREMPPPVLVPGPTGEVRVVDGLAPRIGGRESPQQPRPLHVGMLHDESAAGAQQLGRPCRHRQGQRQACLLYTSPSPRD